MNKKIKVLLGIGAFAVLIIITVFAYNQLSEMGHTPENIAYEAGGEEDNRVRAIDFTVLDQDNNEVRLFDFLGKPIILNFWTTWCPACVAEMPYFEQIYQEMGDDIHVIKVNLREDRAHVDNFMANNGLTFPVYFDTTGEASAIYGVRSIPFSVFIDADGFVVASAQGALNEATMRRGLQMVLSD